MPSQRLTRVNELLKREIAGALYRVLNEDVDVGRITVTHVETAANLRRARVLVSVRGSETEEAACFGLLRRHRKDIQEIVSRNVVLKYTPQLMFVADNSMREGDRVLAMLDDLGLKDDDTDEGEDT